jgi:hypothetical protein
VNNITAESGNNVAAESISILILVCWKQSCQKLGESAIRAEVESAAKNVILGLLHHQHIPY